MDFNDSGILQMLNIIQQMLLLENDRVSYTGSGRGESAVLVCLLLVKCRLSRG